MSNASNKRVDFDTNAKTQEGKHVDYYDGKKPISNIGAGDSFYIPNFVKSRARKDEVFQKLLQEIDFQQMFNFFNGRVETIPRLIAAQTSKSDSKSAIYRMPGCNESNIPTVEWTQTVKEVVDEASKEVNQELNHCVCTLYRNENDSLAFHQDKILDLDEGSIILSLSFGAARPILFHEINGKKRQTIILRPGSLLAFGPKTNKLFKHGVPKVNSPVGARISLSVRHITSYIEKVGDNEFKVTGKGEEHQTKNYPYIKSYDDKSEYTPDIQEEVEKLATEARNEFLKLREKILSEFET